MSQATASKAPTVPHPSPTRMVIYIWKRNGWRRFKIREH